MSDIQNLIDDHLAAYADPDRQRRSDAVRRLWTEDDVTHSGEHFQVERVTLRPRPVQDPIDVWLGGRSPAELRRIGRLGDGWLPSFCTADDVAEGWESVCATAASRSPTGPGSRPRSNSAATT